MAGLAAIGAAKSMGAIVRSFDTRPEVKEQVESMDGEFLIGDDGRLWLQPRLGPAASYQSLRATGD